jgi:hypothetical protein
MVPPEAALAVGKSNDRNVKGGGAAETVVAASKANGSNQRILMVRGLCLRFTSYGRE